MDNVVRDIRKWERMERKVNVGIIVSAAWGFTFAAIITRPHGSILAYNILTALFWLGFAAYIGFSAAKVFIHFFRLDPLIKDKLSEFVQTGETDPDFDVDKYSDWK